MATEQQLLVRDALIEVRDNINKVISLMSEDDGGNIENHLESAWAILNDIHEENDNGNISIKAGIL